MKVTIIGASTSGLFLAYRLAREGVEVEVYEKEDSIGEPARTLIVTSKINEVLDFSPEQAILNKVKFFEILSRSNSTKIELISPDLVIERKNLIKLLAHRAEEVGAKIIPAHQFEGLILKGQKIMLTLKNLPARETVSFPTDILVGSDGLASAVAREFSLDGYRPAALLQARVNLPPHLPPDTCQVFFDSNQTKYFYWVIPESPVMACAGLIADNDEQAKISLNLFLQERNLKPVEFQEGKAPLHRLGWRKDYELQNRNIFLVGDAGAQIKVTTMGGVVTGLWAARALASALLNGRNYRQEWRSLKHELDLHLFIRKVLNQFANEHYDELVQMVKGNLKTVLQHWTRDELTSSFSKLILTEPRLLTFGAKAILKSLFKR